MTELQGWRVKPLVWAPCEEWKRCSRERAPAFGGEYQIVMLDPDDDNLPSLYFEIGLGAFMFRFEQAQDPMGFPGDTCPRKFPSVEAAKAAAQADYEARILAAIEVVEIAPRTLSAPQLADACMSYRHDYGLMTGDEKESLRREAADWWRCFEKTLNDPPAHIRAALTKGLSNDRT